MYTIKVNKSFNFIQFGWIRIIVYLFVFILPLIAKGEKTVKVTGEIIYMVPSTQSRSEAERVAVEKAKADAISKAFGVLVTEETKLLISNGGGSTDGTYFFSNGTTEVKGEWIETIDKPEIIWKDYETVYVKITGKIREIEGQKIDINVKTLRNGIDDRYESTSFRDNDDLYISLLAPVNGQVAIYAQEYNGNVTRLLPYDLQGKITTQVEANKRYVFFSYDMAMDEDRPFIQLMRFECERDVENYIFYILFSPNEFYGPTKGILEDGSIKSSEFLKWVAKSQNRDSYLQRIEIPVSVFK